MKKYGCDELNRVIIRYLTLTLFFEDLGIFVGVFCLFGIVFVY